MPAAVASLTELREALRTAAPGDVIDLAPGGISRPAADHDSGDAARAGSPDGVVAAWRPGSLYSHAGRKARTASDRTHG